MFKIKREDMIDERVYFSRSIKPEMVSLINSLDSEERITIIRIGDKMTDELKIPFIIQDKVCKSLKYCTKPELEILFIIHANIYHSFAESKERCKIYAKENVIINHKKLNSQTERYIEFFKSIDIKYCTNEYKRVHKKAHKKDELFLCDLKN